MTTWSIPDARPASPAIGRIEKLDEPQSVNLQAQGEIKQQSVTICPPCGPTTIHSPVVSGNLRCRSSRHNHSHRRRSIRSHCSLVAMQKASNCSTGSITTLQLYKLRTACDFQVYTASNALYQTRYATIVPVDQFPVVLFQDSTGGHVHAAGRSMLPATPAELYRRSTTRSPALSTNTASPEDRRTENAGLLVG